MNVAAKNHADWEKELVELDEFINKARVAAIKEKNDGERQLLEQKIVDLEKGRDRYMEIMYKNLGDWEKVLVARAQKRPYTLDYVTALFQDFVELQGDRNGFADNAIIGGPALFEGQPVMIVGHQKGRNIQERQQRNFAMAKPEGYRKAIRLFDMADRFGMPVISFVDTPAADPGVESESRGISEAIAAAIMKMFEIRVPSVAVIIIGIAASSRVLMLEHSVYSVIPPEGCAAILWRMPEKGAEASKALKLTAQSAMELGLIDEIISEPMGAAHRKPVEVFDSVREAIRRHLEELSKKSSDQIREERYAKFRSFGQFEEVNL